MNYLESYLKNVAFSDKEMAADLKKSVEDFKLKHIDNFAYSGKKNGLVVGHVQAGKTGQILGDIAAFCDQDITNFILLTTDSVLLQKQTLKRAKKNLKGIEVYDEDDDIACRINSFDKPSVLVLKKNTSVLKNWTNTLKSFKKIGEQPLVIFDDEADAASLNTKVNKKEISTINSLINTLKEIAPSCLYMQVTATPYANLLQTGHSGFKPSFSFGIKPGKNYLGGEFFYGPQSQQITTIDPNEVWDLVDDSADIPEGFKSAVFHHLGCCIYSKYYKDIETCNFIAHPSLKKKDHKILHDKIFNYLEGLKKDIISDSPTLRGMLLDFSRKNKIEDPKDFNLKNLNEIINSTRIYILNSDNSISSEYNRGFNIIIGGNSLSRGVTFPRLQTVYYSRTSKVPQADTIWQHSRIFGYDRFKNLARIFLPPQLRHMFREVSESHHALFKTLEENGVDQISVLSPPGTRPTRKNVVDNGSLLNFTGGVSYFLRSPNHNNTQDLDEFLKKLDGENSTNIEALIKVLEKVSVDPEDKPGLQGYLQSLRLLSNAGYKTATIIVRRNRDITKDTGSLISESDNKLVKSLSAEKPVLVIYRLNGKIENGWQGKPLWNPNICFPKTTCFYGVF